MICFSPSSFFLLVDSTRLLPPLVLSHISRHITLPNLSSNHIHLFTSNEELFHEKLSHLIRKQTRVQKLVGSVHTCVYLCLYRYSRKAFEINSRTKPFTSNSAILFSLVYILALNRINLEKNFVSFWSKNRYNFLAIYFLFTFILINVNSRWKEESLIKCFDSGFT